MLILAKRWNKRMMIELQGFRVNTQNNSKTRRLFEERPHTRNWWNNSQHTSSQPLRQKPTKTRRHNALCDRNDRDRWRWMKKRWLCGGYKEQGFRANTQTHSKHRKDSNWSCCDAFFTTLRLLVKKSSSVVRKKRKLFYRAIVAKRWL